MGVPQQSVKVSYIIINAPPGPGKKNLAGAECWHPSLFWGFGPTSAGAHLTPSVFWGMSADIPHSKTPGLCTAQGGTLTSGRLSRIGKLESCWLRLMPTSCFSCISNIAILRPLKTPKP